MAEHRAVFDFRITFSNGGEISGSDFRLDVPRPDVDPAEVGVLLVRHLGLLMVDEVELHPFGVVEEPHRGGRGLDAPAATGSKRRIVDLSHPIRDGMITYPGLPGPEITDHLSRAAAEDAYAPGVTFHIGRISMVANTGTYVDSPFHRYDGGVDLAGLALDRLVDLDGLVVRLTGSAESGRPARAAESGRPARVAESGRRGVDVAQLAPFDVAGRAVLLHTGGDRDWGTPAYLEDSPFLTGPAAEWLVEHGAALVGIDSVNIDDVEDRTRPAHSILLDGAGVPIVEHMRGLDRLPPQGFRFHAAPPAIEEFGTFPVRAYALVGSA